MSCIINSGIALECRDNMGGIQSVYIANAVENFAFFPAAGLIPILTFNPATENTFYEFAQQIESASYEETGGYSVENGTAFYTQKLTIKIYKMNSSNSDVINILGQSLFNIIFLDQNGNYFLPGAFNQMRVVEISYGSGKMMGDLSGATIVFEGREKRPAYQVSTAAAIFAIVKPDEPTAIGQLIGTTPAWTLSLSGDDNDILYNGVMVGVWAVDNANITTVAFPSTPPARLGIFAALIGTCSVSYTIGAYSVSQIITVIA